jgi:predicted MFS family arabinose efflux permease
MALFTMSFSLAHIASSKTGLEIIDQYGYQSNWFVMGTLGILAVGGVSGYKTSTTRKQ